LRRTVAAGVGFGSPGRARLSQRLVPNLSEIPPKPDSSKIIVSFVAELVRIWTP